MTIETDISALATSTRNLQTAVETSKALLDQKVSLAATNADKATSLGAAQVALATTQAVAAATSATAAASEASLAATHTTNTLAIYGTSSARASSETSANTAATASTTSASSAAASAVSALAAAKTANDTVLGVASLTLPSVAPSLNLDFAGSKTLDPRITFSRASTATYYDGKTVAKAEENLLTYSQEFGNAVWSKNAASVVNNVVVAPDGSVTADKLVESDTNSAHTIQRAGALTVGQEYVFSIYVKAAGRSYAFFADSAANGISVNLTNGTIATVVGSVSNASAVEAPAGSGWWRVSFAFIAFGTFLNLYVAQDAVWANRFFQGDGTSGIYIWGAQLEQRSQVTAYTPTTTQPINNYIPVLQTAPAGVPRFDHDPVTGESLGLLVEEQRTNLLTYSEQFGDASWTKTRSSIFSNTVTAPDGTQTAALLTENLDATTTHWLGKTVSLTQGVTYSLSFYARAASRSQVWITTSGVAFGATLGAYFDLASGSVLSVSDSVSASIKNVGNGWFRCTITRTAADNGSGGCNIYTATNGTAFYPGDGYSGIYVWGAQLEAGTFPTSYTKTETSQVTRAADSADILTNSSWYSASEHTALAEFSANNTPTSYAGVLWFNQGSASKGLALSKSTSAGGRQTTVYQRGNDLSLKIIWLGVQENGVFSKACIAYKNTEVSGAQSGVVASPVAVTSELIATKMTIGYQNGAGAPSYLNGHIKRITYYPKRLTDAQLQALTS